MPECAPCPKTERPREGQERATCRCPPHARRTAHGSLHGHARATGTSSPPHDVQTASSQPRPREGGRPASGVPFRDGRATAQAHNGRRSPKPGQRGLVGLGRLERPTSRLSGVRSNQLSYRPRWIRRQHADGSAQPSLGCLLPSACCSLIRKGCVDGGRACSDDSRQITVARPPRSAFCPLPSAP